MAGNTAQSKDNEHLRIEVSAMKDIRNIISNSHIQRNPTKMGHIVAH